MNHTCFGGVIRARDSRTETQGSRKIEKDLSAEVKWTQSLKAKRQLVIRATGTGGGGALGESVTSKGPGGKERAEVQLQRLGSLLPPASYPHSQARGTMLFK